jgi:hypothetical protein
MIVGYVRAPQLEWREPSSIGPIVSHQPKSFAREAFDECKGGTSATDFAIWYGLDFALMDKRLHQLSELVDPNCAGGRIGGEPGWSIERQMETGEERRLVARLRVEFANAKPKPPTFAEPSPDERPDLGWPSWARFKAELAFPDKFGNPAHPLRCCDAKTFEGFLTKMLTVYLKYHPESAQQVEQILASAAYWVKRDATRGERGI